MQLTTCSWQKKQVQRQMHLKALLLSSFALAIVLSFLFPLTTFHCTYPFHCFLLPVVSPLSFLISDICSSIFFFALVLVLVLCSFFPLSTFFFPLSTFHCTYPFHFPLIYASQFPNAVKASYCETSSETCISKLWIRPNR